MESFKVFLSLELGLFGVLIVFYLIEDLRISDNPDCSALRLAAMILPLLLALFILSICM